MRGGICGVMFTQTSLRFFFSFCRARHLLLAKFCVATTRGTFYSPPCIRNDVDNDDDKEQVARRPGMYERNHLRATKGWHGGEGEGEKGLRNRVGARNPRRYTGADREPSRNACTPLLAPRMHGT